jgi:hypothetical protein
MPKRPHYPGELPTWRALKVVRHNEKSSTIQKKRDSATARKAKSRQLIKIHLNEVNEHRQKECESKARERYFCSKDWN